MASPADAQLACPQVFPDTPAIEYGDAAHDRYGSSVAVDGVYAVVGATQAGQGQSTGYAEFLKYDAGLEIWEPLGTHSAGVAGAWFGASAAISGDFAVVGAPSDKVDNKDAAGAVYVFQRDPNTDLWLPFGNGDPLTATAPQQDALFGQSVAISGDWIIVGEPQHDAGGMGDAGAVYLFEYDDQSETWIRRTTIEGLDGDDLFGWSVAIDGDTAVVGAINANPTEAYVLEREG